MATEKNNSGQDNTNRKTENGANKRSRLQESSREWDTRVKNTLSQARKAARRRSAAS